MGFSHWVTGSRSMMKSEICLVSVVPLRSTGKAWELWYAPRKSVDAGHLVASSLEHALPTPLRYRVLFSLCSAGTPYMLSRWKRPWYRHLAWHNQLFFFSSCTFDLCVSTSPTVPLCSGSLYAESLETTLVPALGMA